MFTLIFICLLALLWVPFTLIKYVFGDKTYQSLLDKTSFTHSLGSFGFETDLFSNLMMHWGQKYRKSLRIWFNIGTVISLVLSLVCSAFLVGHILYFLVQKLVWFIVMTGLISSMSTTKSPFSSFFFGSSSSTVNNTSMMNNNGTEAEEILASYMSNRPDLSLVMLIPGINVPVGDISFMIIALFICAVVHEFGHAIAAAADKIRTDVVGFNLFFMFPSAYVVLPTRDLNRSSFLGRLRIFCAGAWHNIVLCIIVLCFMIFFCSSGYATSLIETNVEVMNGHDGVFVERIDDDSPLKDLLHGKSAYITAVGHCATPNQESWVKCLTEMMQKHDGHCVPKQRLIESHQLFGEACCTRMHERQLCFDVKDERFFKLSSSPLPSFNPFQRTCMIAREVTKYTPCIERCDNEDDVCVAPMQQDEEDGAVDEFREHLIRIKLYRDNNNKNGDNNGEEDTDVIYFGTIPSLYQQVETSHFRVIKPLDGIISLGTLARLEKLCRYIFALSSALALLNLAPVYMLDGAKVYEAIFIYLSMKYYVSITPTKLKNIYHKVCRFFTILLVVNLAISMLNMVQMVFSKRS